jgi:hypothetical protein
MGLWDYHGFAEIVMGLWDYHGFAEILMGFTTIDAEKNQLYR